MIGSPKTRIPTVSAVTGSTQPMIEVVVEPILFMARIRVKLDRSVDTSDRSVSDPSTSLFGIA